MHETSGQPEFMKTVKEIKTAEEEYDRLIIAAKEKADAIVRKARESTLEERSKREDMTVALKNKQLQEGAKEIEGLVQKMIAKAKEEADKLSKKKLERLTVSKLAKDFLSGL